MELNSDKDNHLNYLDSNFSYSDHFDHQERIKEQFLGKLAKLINTKQADDMKAGK